MEQPVIKALNSPRPWQVFDIAIKFQDRWNFPNDIGCIGGMHIHIKYFPKAGSLFYSYIFFSTVLQEVAYCESRFIFMDITVGTYGNQCDGTFAASTLYHILKDFKSTLLKPAIFEESGTEMPFVIRDDEAYSLKTYVMKSFVREDLSAEERVFKYRLSQARRCTECAFVILTTKWPLLNKATNECQ